MHSATAGDFSDLSIVGTLGDAPAAVLVARRLGASQSLRSCAVVGDEVVAAAGFGFSIASGVLSLPRAIPPNRSRLSGVVPEARSRIGWAAVSPFSQEKYWGSSMPLIYRAVASHELVADASRPTISHRLGESISSVIGRKMPQHPHLRDGLIAEARRATPIVSAAVDCRGGSPQDFAFFEGFDVREPLRAAA